MAIAAAIVANQQGPTPLGDGRLRELWSVTGSTGVDGDNTTITPKFITKPEAVLGGAFGVSISGNVITVTSLFALDNASVYVEVIGMP